MYVSGAGLRMPERFGKAALAPEAKSLWMRVASRPLREHRGVSEARKAEPASTRLARDGTGSGSRTDVNRRTGTMERFCVGLDVSAKTLDVAYRDRKRGTIKKIVANDASGHRELVQLLKSARTRSPNTKHQLCSGCDALQSFDM